MRKTPIWSTARRGGWIILALCAFALSSCGGRAAQSGTVTVHLDRPISRFRGDAPLGAGLDGHGQGEIAQIYTRRNLRAMRSAGFGPLTYRLRTELGAEAWHWNPLGSWSDPKRRQGYWVSASTGPRYPVSYGYRLPRRGNTIDQANDDGYSRLDDGDPHTYWKSNPYLDSHFTGEPDASHPQSIMVDLGGAKPVDAVELDWADPYARHSRLQYWVGSRPPWRNGGERENALYAAAVPAGHWVDFAGQPATGHGGVQTVRVAQAPVNARYLRVLMTGGSRTHARSATDIRDRLGYAMREIRIGRIVNGRLSDYVRHAPDNTRQSVIWVSSTDPWHRASDIDLGTEQPSFDKVFSSGLGAHRPVLVPIAMAYGDPADAAAELRFLRARRYPVAQIEMGEEPDGQNIGPEDYGALYAQFARALHAVDRGVELGGPGFSTSIPDWTVSADASGDTSWTRRFVAQLRRTHALGALKFFSFEWYPFDDVCRNPTSQLIQAPSMLQSVIQRQRAAGLPAGLPMLITEYGYSPFAAQAEVELPGALLDADIAASFMSFGGSVSYFYGLEPDAPMRESRYCASYGNLVLFESDDQHRIKYPMPTYYAARLLTQKWLDPRRGSAQSLLQTDSSVRDGQGRPIVTAYAVARGSSGGLSVLLINKDPLRAHVVRFRVQRGAGASALRGPLDLYQYSPAQYKWHAAGDRGHPVRDEPPVHIVVAPRGEIVLKLPPSSLSVARARASS
jgi:hypothetical protein